MTIYDDYFLSGGVLFMLLTDLIPGKRPAREHQQGLKDACNEKEQMYNLSKTLCGSPSEDRSFESQKTNYKGCVDEGGIALPFNESSSITSYDSKVKNQYEEALKEMQEFVDKSINTSKLVWFVRAVFDLLDKDKSISLDSEFYALGDGGTIKKKDLLVCEKLEIEPFLIGMWHFILTKRKGQNRKGGNTLGYVYRKITQRKHEYIGEADKWESLKSVTRWKPKEAEPVITEVVPTLDEDPYQKVIDEQVMRTGEVLRSAFQGINSIINSDGLYEGARVFKDAISAEKKKMTEDIMKNKETTFVDKQLNGNVTQVHMINSGNGNQNYIVQGDFVDNRGRDNHDEE